MNPTFWNSRYSEEGLAYGLAPNAFLCDALSRHIPHGTERMSVLCLAEGQGRNALHITKKYSAEHARVIAVDYSEVGVQTTNALASKEDVSDRLVAHVADLDNYDLLTHCPKGSGGYDLIISIFGHTPSAIRTKVHANIANALAPGGLFILQAYTEANMGRGTGGPQVADFCMSKDGLLNEVQGLEVLELDEKEAVVEEGKYHQGLAAVVQGVWKKSA